MAAAPARVAWVMMILLGCRAPSNAVLGVSVVRAVALDRWAVTLTARSG
jgi:hypothetical protein